MNRRGFLRSLGMAAAAFTVLPAATTYARRWVKPGLVYVANPAWRTAEYEWAFIIDRHFSAEIQRLMTFNYGSTYEKIAA